MCYAYCNINIGPHNTLLQWLQGTLKLIAFSNCSINQVTYLYDTFCQALEAEKEVQVVFCDISKAFDRVWYRGFLHTRRWQIYLEIFLGGLLHTLPI